jgi:transcriptional regulator with XRE-family HTH domain
MARGVHREEYAKLRQALVAARESAGVTQAALARRLGRSQSFVAKYELGDRRLDVVDYLAVCRELGVDPSHLLRLVVSD